MGTIELGELPNSAEIKAIDPTITVWPVARVEGNTLTSLRFNFGVTNALKEPIENGVSINWCLVMVVSLSLSSSMLNHNIVPETIRKGNERKYETATANSK